MSVEIVVSEEFVDRYKKLPIAIQRKTQKQEILLRANPFHPSLHTEKLEPKSKERWSFRVDYQYRALFRFLDPHTILLITVGTYDWLYRRK